MLTTLLLLAATAGADPLAEARAGKIQCVAPNPETRSCTGIVTYLLRPDGSFDSVTTILVAPAPLMTMEIRSSGKVEGEAVCVFVRRSDYERATVTREGATASAEMEQPIRNQVVASMAPMEGKKACAHDHAAGDVILSEVTLDGVPQPQLNQRYLWVDPEDGWKVAP